LLFLTATVCHKHVKIVYYAAMLNDVHRLYRIVRWNDSRFVEE
jgi:hypothetical protein